MTGILQEFREKIKELVCNQNIYLTLVIILVAVVSFGLGQRSVKEDVRTIGGNAKAKTAKRTTCRFAAELNGLVKPT